MKDNWLIFVIWLLVAAVLCFGLLAMEQSGCATRTVTSASVNGDTDGDPNDDRSVDDRSESDKKSKKDKKDKKDEMDRKAEDDDGESRTTIDAVINSMSELRGLPLNNEIEVTYLDRDELQKQVEGEFSEEFSPAEVEAEEQALKAIDLIDEQVDLLAAMEDLLVDQIAGYYDDETKELALISEDDELDVMNEVTLSHEVTHALQDQNFNLETIYPLEGPATGDANIARLALVEGDASLAMTEYVESELSIADLVGLGLAAGSEVGGMSGAPSYLDESLTFPYLAGEDFVGYMKEKGGWELVNAIYSYPPESTEQILHPEKYLEGDHPLYIETPELLPLSGPSWELVYDESFGEFDVRQLLNTGLMYDDAAVAAAGWRGGRYSYYERSDGADMAVILLAWDSKAEADEFTFAMQAYLEEIYGNRFEFEDWQFPILETINGDYWVMVSRGTGVMVARVPDKTLANKLPPAILGAEPPQPDILADMAPGSILTQLRQAAGFIPLDAPAT